MNELNENNLYKEYTEKLKPDYSFENIDFTKLSKDDSYLITVAINVNDYDIIGFCKGLKSVLDDKGFNNIIIAPLKNGIPLVNIYKKENGNK